MVQTKALTHLEGIEGLVKALPREVTGDAWRQLELLAVGSVCGRRVEAEQGTWHDRDRGRAARLVDGSRGHGGGRHKAEEAGTWRWTMRSASALTCSRGGGARARRGDRRRDARGRELHGRGSDDVPAPLLEIERGRGKQRRSRSRSRRLDVGGARDGGDDVDPAGRSLGRRRHGGRR